MKGSLYGNTILKYLWLIISNTYLLPFWITGIDFFIAKEQDIWFGETGGKFVYLIISIFLFVIFNWNNFFSGTLIADTLDLAGNIIYVVYSFMTLAIDSIFAYPILIVALTIIVGFKIVRHFI